MMSRLGLRDGVGALIVVAYYAALVAIGWLAFGGPSQHSLVFNSMALHLLDGRFDVEPAVIGDEAHVHQGRSYAYFGVLPALLRMPLHPFLDLRTAELEPVFVLLAMLLGAAGQVAALRAALGPAVPGTPRGDLAARLQIAAIASGPAVMLGLRPTVFVEAMLWAWALAMIFIAVAVPALRAPREAPWSRLGVLGAIAGLCLHARPSTGIGLCTAVALLLCTAVRPAPHDPHGGLRQRAGAWCAGILDRRILLPGLLCAALIGTAAGVNVARWGNPFVFADLRQQVALIAQYPDRLVRLETYGLFLPARAWLGVVYYFFPVWVLRDDGGFLFHEQIREYFDGFELPPASFFLTDPLTMLLAAGGILGLARVRGGDGTRTGTILVLCALAIPPVMLLSGWYMAFRYRAEFMPLFFLCACLGATRLAAWLGAATPGQRRRASLGLAVLLVLQVLSAHLHAGIVAASVQGPSNADTIGAFRAMFLLSPESM